MLLLPSSVMLAQEEITDSAFLAMYSRFLKLYDSEDTQKYQAVSDSIKNYYLERNNLESYFKMHLNDVMYETSNGKAYSAIKKANAMLEEMKSRNYKGYYLVYTALATIYESRGNYRLADHYFMNAFKNVNTSDSSSILHIYSRMAVLKAAREPQKAWEWNEKYATLCKDKPAYYKIYIVNKGSICFFLGDRKTFDKTYQEYEKLRNNKTIVDDDYGATIMGVARSAFDGNYEHALKLLERTSQDFTSLDKCDYRIKIYEMMGKSELALAETSNRRDLRDSLNSDMLFNNINEINAEMELAKINEKANKRQKALMAAVILLLLAALGLIIWRHLTRRRYQKKLVKQNKELEIALSRAEESDRMKDSFIEHVSHEIRTPLNVITGYAQIITNPHYKLTDEQRNRFIADISKNTTEITYIVNELLEVAQDESREHYHKDDSIALNNFCRKLLERAEARNTRKLHMTFDTDVTDDFVLKSNSRALEKVLEQLLNNAMKFTQEGSINLHVQESPDHGVVRFIVTDTGIGIAKEHQEQIFERFFKVDTFKQGFGLGLTMSRKMATLLGGSLNLDTTYTHGARFILTLPA